MNDETKQIDVNTLKLNKPDIHELGHRLRTVSMLLSELASIIKRKYEADVDYIFANSDHTYNPGPDKEYDLNNKENRGNLCDLANVLYVDSLDGDSNVSNELDALNNTLGTLEDLLGVKYE